MIWENSYWWHSKLCSLGSAPTPTCHRLPRYSGVQTASSRCRVFLWEPSNEVSSITPVSLTIHCISPQFAHDSGSYSTFRCPFRLLLLSFSLTARYSWILYNHSESNTTMLSGLYLYSRRRFFVL